MEPWSRQHLGAHDGGGDGGNVVRVTVLPGRSASAEMAECMFSLLGGSNVHVFQACCLVVRRPAVVVYICNTFVMLCSTACCFFLQSGTAAAIAAGVPLQPGENRGTGGAYL